jgi:hypothetical protein
MEYVRNKRYFFASTPLMVFVGIVIMIGFANLLAGSIRLVFGGDSATNWIVGVLLSAAGIVFVVVMNKRMSSEEQVDMQVQEEVNQLNKKALDKHGITEEAVQRSVPLVFGGYIVDENIVAKLFVKNVVATTVTVDGAKPVRTAISPIVSLGSVMSAGAIAVDNISAVKHKRTNRDGIARSTLAEYTIFLFSEDKVFVYTRQFSLIDPETKEAASAYSYGDILSISSETSKYGSHTLTVKTSGGNTLAIPSSNARAAGIKESVTTFMQLVRDKKNA